MISGLLELMFPDKIYCISCGSATNSENRYGLCPKCLPRLQPVGVNSCGSCGKEIVEESLTGICSDCSRGERYFDAGYTCFNYSLYERNLTLDFKYGSKAYLGRHMGNMMAERMLMEEGEWELIIPVPAHVSRGRSRGYNQAEVLALQVGRQMGIPVIRDALKRVKNTQPMSGLGRDDREANLKDAFRVISAKKSSISCGKILLIDDIYTTGATVNNCSRILKEAGAKEVAVLTFAAGGDYLPA